MLVPVRGPGKFMVVMEESFQNFVVIWGHQVVGEADLIRIVAARTKVTPSYIACHGETNLLEQHKWGGMRRYCFQ